MRLPTGYCAGSDLRQEVESECVGGRVCRAQRLGAGACRLLPAARMTDEGACVGVENSNDVLPM